MAKLDPMDVATFAIQKRAAKRTAGQELAQLTFDSNTAREQLQRNLLGLDITGERTRNRLPGAFAQRGLLNSGIYKDALANYATDQTYQRQNYLLQAQQQIGGYSLRQKQVQQNLAAALADISQAKQARRAQVARQLRGL